VDRGPCVRGRDYPKSEPGQKLVTACGKSMIPHLMGQSGNTSTQTAT